MIFYFSGTGNSRYIAKHIATLTNDTYISITEKEISPTDDERIGLFFPVHAWSAPIVMEEFLRNRLPKLITHPSPYIYMVCTCGDDIGKTHNIVAEILKRNNLHLSAAFSLIMPDSYIGLPGFDINSEEVERSKIEQSIKKLPRIAEFILQNKTVEEVKPGPFPWSKSFILRPLFYRFFAGVRLFRSTEKCIGCGRCKNICPMQNIKLENKRPHWGNDCANCLACYHICPKKCIEYGRFSKGKGQYKLLINNK